MELVLVGSRPIAQAAFLQFGSTGPDSLVIDATKLTYACPLDLVGIVATAHFGAGCGMGVTLKLPSDSDVAAYLQRMDVLRQMPSRTQILGRVPPDRRADLRGSLLEVTALHVTNATDLTERLGPVVQDFYRSHSASGGALVFGACGELLSNAVEHGSSDSGAFIAAQTYSGATTEGPRIEFAICDSGIGVMQRLRENPNFAYLARDELAISEAMRAGVSGKSDEGRGNGLRDVIEETRRHGRIDFQMRSGRGQVRVTGSPTTHSQRPSDRPDQTNGTWAWLSHWPSG